MPAMRPESVPSVVLPSTERVPVAVMLEAVSELLKKPLPATERVAKGEVVPMPSIPFAVGVLDVAEPE